jgi:hypothetical protein
MTDNSISIVTLVSQSALRLFYPALPNTCEALVAMHTIFTHSKDLPEDIFKAGAQFVLRILCLLSSLLQSVSTSVLSILRYQTLTCEALVAMHTIFTHSKDLPGDIFKAGAQFVLRILCLLSSLLQSVSQHFGSFYPALPNTCEALLAMHNMFTHSKDLPKDIFKAGAQLVFILHERFRMTEL